MTVPAHGHYCQRRRCGISIAYENRVTRHDSTDWLIRNLGVLQRNPVEDISIAKDTRKSIVIRRGKAALQNVRIERVGFAPPAVDLRPTSDTRFDLVS